MIKNTDNPKQSTLKGIDRPSENWTRFPNAILDNLHEYTANEFKILGLMVRKNFGFDQPNKKFSINYIALKCGIKTRSTTRKSLHSLLEKGTVVCIGQNDNGTNHFDVNWREVGQKLTQGGSKTDPGGGSKTDPIIRTHILQETIVKNIARKNGQTFNLTKSITNLFDRGFLKLESYKLSWEGNGGKYGSAVKRLIKSAAKEEITLEAQFEHIRARATVLYNRLRSQVYVKGERRFLPTTLSSNWNDCTPPKRIAPVAEISDAEYEKQLKELDF